MIIITSTEPKEIKELFGKDMIEDVMGFDMMLLTNRGKLPMERKKVPGDLLSSVTDGRLKRELDAMRVVSPFNIILLHGTFSYRKDDSVVMYGNKGRNWTKRGVRNLLRTLQYVEGCYIEQAETDEELVQVVHELQDYFDKDLHLSFKTRCGIQTDWLIPSKQEKIMYFYQGLPEVKAIRAKALSERFPSPLDLYQASIEQLMEVSGIGKKLATGIYEFLRSGK